MPTATPITRQTVGLTFTVAIAILGAGAILQLAAVCWAFVERFHAPPAPYVLVAPEPGETLTFAHVAPAPDFTLDPLDVAPAPPRVAPAPPKPTPIPAQTTRPLEPQSAERFDELLEQGKMLRERGDTGAALTKFREAQGQDARSPRALAEIAVTYEKMGLADRANEQWKRIYDLGETAGVLYAAAEAKLRAAQANDLARAVAQAGPAQDEISGIARSATLGLLEIKMEEAKEAGISKKFLLRVPIKARPGVRVDANEMRIKVFFYDMVDSARTEITAANVSSRWSTAPPDWADSDIEELEVTYELPAEKLNRKYFGYLVWLYYKGALQAATGMPDSLMQKSPAPQSLQTESNQ